MKPTDAIIRITATYVCGRTCGRGINRVAEPTFLHCLTGGARRLADPTSIDVLGKSVAHRVADFVVALALKTIAAAKHA